MLIGSTRVKELSDSVIWTSGLECDTDGCPFSYSPAHSELPALDDLRNAGSVNNWFGLATNAYGIPFIQGPKDPNPGYYISVTSLVDHARKVNDPLRYVDASKVPYIAIPPEIVHAQIYLGYIGIAMYGDKFSPFIIADIGPRKKIGEGSFALHKVLGVDPQRAKPKHLLVGIDSGVKTLVFKASVAKPAWPRDFTNDALARFAKWGGIDRLKSFDTNS